MPSIVSHGIIGYLLFGYEGIFWSTLPDIIGFSRYFSRIGYDYLKNIDKKKFNWPNPDLMDQTDWKLYDISHSLIFWFILLFVFKKKRNICFNYISIIRYFFT